MKMNNENKLTLRIGSYNICHAKFAAGDIDKIARVINDARLDIVGMQELDLNTQRVGGNDQPAMIAAAAGMKYYRFCPSIDFQGGKYGTMILSKYPIAEYERIELVYGEPPKDDAETRAAGHALIDANGFRFDFFNTHIALRSKELQLAQIAQIGKSADKCGSYIITGDFNTEDFSSFSSINYGKLLNSDGDSIVTFPIAKSEKGGVSIDNMVLSKNWTVIERNVIKEAYTDHYMLFAELSTELN